MIPSPHEPRNRPLPRRGALLLAAGILSWTAEAGAGVGFDGWRGDVNGLYESSHPVSGLYSNGYAPATGFSSVSDWQWYWRGSGVLARAGIEGGFLFPLSTRYHHLARGGFGLRELNLSVPFGDSGSGSRIQLGVIPVRPGEEPDLFGDYVARYEPYPGLMLKYPWSFDSLGAMEKPNVGLRAALGGAGDPVRAEFLALWERRDDFSFLGYLEGTLPSGFGWGLGMGWRHAVAGEAASQYEDEMIWAETESGYLPIDSARNAGLTSSDSGGITASGWVLSARLRWIRTAEPVGRFGAFGEAALLGVANQPLYYEDRWRRIAATVGAYLPTGGLLQICLIQTEWRPGGYRRNDALQAWAGYGHPYPSPSAWSYAALLGRDFGRHWGLRARIAYAPRDWTYGTYSIYGPEIDPVYPSRIRGENEFSYQIRTVFRFGPIR